MDDESIDIYKLFAMLSGKLHYNGLLCMQILSYL